MLAGLCPGACRAEGKDSSRKKCTLGLVVLKSPIGLLLLVSGVLLIWGLVTVLQSSISVWQPVPSRGLNRVLKAVIM